MASDLKLKTPWLISGPDGAYATRAVAEEICGSFFTFLEVQHRLGPCFAGATRTDCGYSGGISETLNALARFTQSHQLAPVVFSLPDGKTDFRTYAKHAGLIFTTHGYVPKASLQTILTPNAPAQA